MQELLEKIRTVCAGLTPEEIEAQIAASQYASAIPDAATLSRFLAAVAQADPNPALEAPEDDQTIEQSGNEG